VSDMCIAINDGCWPALRSFDVGHTRLSQADIVLLASVSLARFPKLNKLCLPSFKDDLHEMESVVEKSGRCDLRVRQKASSFIISDGSPGKPSCMFPMTPSVLRCCDCIGT